MKKGFTLAEVLITLGIIGVVAALTLPNLIANYEKKLTETRIAKFYSSMQQSIQMAKVKYGDEEFVTSSTAVRLPVKAFNQLFEGMALSPCKVSDKYYQESQPYTGGWIGSSQASLSCGITKDGMYIGSNHDSITATSTFTIFVDINGERPPNKGGRDVFGFVYFANVPDILEGTSWGIGTFDTSKTELRNGDKAGLYPIGYGWGGCVKGGTSNTSCTNKIMQDGWHIAADYPWNSF